MSPAHKIETVSERTLLVLSCSHEKRQGGERFDADRRSFRNLLSHDVEEDFLSKKRAILKMLQGGPPRLYNRDQKGGYCDERESNQRLELGPDFGGRDVGAQIYFPACERYTGRFFSKLKNKDSAFWDALPGQFVEVILISGLYGILLWDEPIQEYDCHFADHAEGEPDQTVRRCWDTLLTSAVCDFLRNMNQSSRVPITRVYDLLSEESYQLVLDWNKIASCDVKVFHRIFKNSAGPDILSSLATILATQLHRLSQGTDRFEREQWYTLPGVPDAFGFEAVLFDNPGSAREDVKKDALRRILDEFKELRTLPRRILDGFALAEGSWQIVQPLREFDYGAIIVSYSRAVESYFTWKYPQLKANPLGTIAREIRNLPRGEIAGKALQELANLRRIAAHGPHSALALTKTQVLEARRLTFKAAIHDLSLPTL